MESMETQKRQYITFKMESNTFGIPIKDVQEVATVKSCTPVPLSTACIKGLLNLRGQIVTVIDLRDFFAVSKPNNLTEQERNIFVTFNNEIYALTVSCVGDVVDVTEEEITSSPPDLDSRWKKACTGIYSLENEVVIILDLMKILKDQNFTMEYSA